MGKEQYRDNCSIALVSKKHETVVFEIKMIPYGASFLEPLQIFNNYMTFSREETSPLWFDLLYFKDRVSDPEIIKRAFCSEDDVQKLMERFAFERLKGSSEIFPIANFPALDVNWNSYKVKYDVDKILSPSTIFRDVVGSPIALDLWDKKEEYSIEDGVLISGPVKSFSKELSIFPSEDNDSGEDDGFEVLGELDSHDLDLIHDKIFDLFEVNINHLQVIKLFCLCPNWNYSTDTDSMDQFMDAISNHFIGMNVPRCGSTSDYVSKFWAEAKIRKKDFLDFVNINK